MKKFMLPVLMLLAITARAQLKADDVKTFTLKNGMKFLVVEDNSIPNANMYLFYKVGSRNEYQGITGLSHFFEHMMFNGAKKFGPKEFDRTMEFNGGANNAYTREDITAYTNWFPSSATETIFDLEGDRISSLSIDPKMVESERGVVLSVHKDGVDEQSLTSAKNYVKGQFPPRYETSGQLSSLLVQMFWYNFNESYINNFQKNVDGLTLEKAKDIIAKYFPKDKLQFIMVDKSSEIKKIVEKYGPVTEMQIKEDPKKAFQCVTEKNMQITIVLMNKIKFIFSGRA